MTERGSTVGLAGAGAPVRRAEGRAAAPRGRRVEPLTIWTAAAVGVPTVLAAIALVWPGPAIRDGLTADVRSALAATGLPAVVVTVEGRDVLLDGVPRGAEERAVAAAAGVGGVGAVTIGPGTVGPDTSGAVPGAGGPDGPPADGAAAGPDAVAGRVAALLAAAPITFDPDSPALGAAARGTAEQVAAVLRAAPDVRITVEGHVADTPGSPDVAQRLSEQRAAAVADVLAAGGVDRARMTVRGLGASRPLATPETSRRVEIGVG